MNHPYGSRFWSAYVANTSLMVAVSLLFRYADFVESLGGSEEQLGWITGLGMFGAIAGRCFQGVAIDHYGAARIWLLSLILLFVCLLAHLAVTTLTPPFVHILRLCYAVSLAGAFGASITFVSLRAPLDRMGEMIGMLGSSGFVGMAIGPSIGDRIFAQADSARAVPHLFVAASVAAATSFVFAVLATRGHRVSSPGQMKDPNPVRTIVDLIRMYHPGWTLLVGVAMGIGIGMPGTFLSTFATEKGFADLGWFFLPYATVAFVVRIFTRKLADRWGTRPTILVGLTCLGLSMLAYLAVTVEQSLVIPASFAGFAHAFLFPATVSEGNQSFPVASRGLATTLTLTMFDVGLLIGQPAFGWTVEAARARGWDGYFVAFVALGSSLFTVALLYAVGKPTQQTMRMNRPK